MSDVELKGKARQEEIIKCGKDPIYFMKRYVYITHADRGLIKFETYPFQDDCVQAFRDHRYNIINKSRQLGLSTVTAAYCLWMAVFQRQKNILVIATRLDVSKNFLRKVRQMFDGLPKWLVLPDVKAESVKYIEFTNGSRVTAVPTGKDAGRSEALSLLVVDEAAHIENFDELWAGLKPAISCLTGKTKVFTDNGIYNIEDFHKERKSGEYFKIENSPKIFGKNGLEILSHGYVSPESETLTLTTKHGYQIEATLKHPLWKLNSYGGEMCQTQNIKIGDYLRVQSNMNCFGNQIIDDNLAYMLGGYIAEGNCPKTYKKSHYTIQITNVDEEFRSIFLQSKKVLGKNFVVKPSEPIKLFCYSKKAVQQFINLGIDPNLKCYNKVTPKSIWKATKDSQASYLSGLFDGDGCVSENGITLTSTSLGLIQETQLLLLNMGFLSNIQSIDGQKNLAREQKSQRIMPHGKTIQTLKDSWHLTIPRSQFKKFANEVGFKIKRKQSRLLNLSKIYIQNDFKLFTIPVEQVRSMIEEIKSRSEKTDIWFRKRGLRFDKWKSSSKRGERFLTVDWISNFRKLLKENNFIESEQECIFFDNVIGSFFWDKVTKIEESFSTTYDFTVPNTHTFIQNGILGSNTGGSVILLSSPKGVGSLFHKIWNGAKNQSNNFNAIELPWFVHPEHDEEWFKKESLDMDQRLIAQEFLCNFGSSGETFVNSQCIVELEAEIKNPVALYEFNPDVWIWKFPIPARKYIISADVSRGDAEDFSTFHVFDTEESEVVAEYRGKKPPDRFAELLVQVGMYYNTALICNEKNNQGLTTSYKLRDLKYPNLYYENIARGGVDPMELTPEDLEEEIPGFTTSVKTRTPLVSRMEQAIRNKVIKIYSSRFVEELKTFMWVNSRAQALKGYNDDLIISFAIGAYIYEFTKKTNSVDSKELAAAMMNAWGKNTTMYDPAMANILGATGFIRQSTTNSNQPKSYPMLPSLGSARSKQNQIPPGVHPDAIQRHLDIQAMFGWVDDPPKQKK